MDAETADGQVRARCDDCGRAAALPGSERELLTALRWFLVAHERCALNVSLDAVVDLRGRAKASA